MADAQIAVNDMPDVQIAVIDQQDTQIALAVPGIQGEGVPDGGTTGQLLAKASGDDYDLEWINPNPGDITGVTAGTGLTGGGTSGDVTLSLAAALDDLSDVDVTSTPPSDGEALVFDNATSTWIPGAAGATALDDLTDVDLQTSPPSDGEALVYDNATSTWVPGSAGATAAGSANEIQYNDGASGLAASADLTWDDSAKELGVGGDINLDDGGTYTTTVQTVTPTANRTISFPDATGTVALVAGSTGQLAYNNAGSNAGLTSASIGSTGEINISLAGAASTPPVKFTGSWFTGGTSTTTKPQLLIEPTGTTSTAWSTSGTGIGVNAASGFTGNLLDLQINGTSELWFQNYGNYSGFRFGGANIFIVRHTPTSYLEYRTTNTQYGHLFTVSGQFCFGTRRWNNIPGAVVGSNGYIGWGDGNGNNAQQLYLWSDASNVFAQRNGTNAQTYRLYNTYTDASNYERGFLQWNSNVLEIGTEGAGTGSEQPVRITAATLKLPNLPTYADNAAATTGGLVAGDVYKTATGELRITV